MRISPRNRRLHTAGIILVSVIVACTAGGTLLNSERISRKYGNYNLELIENNKNIRVSNLYSEGPHGAICRTFAVVRIATPPDASIAAEHAEIDAGGSIGAVFRSRGWKVAKRHLYIGEIAIDEFSTRISRLMRLETPSRLAFHIYIFRVKKGDLIHDYATIAEIHHPDYLDAAGLRSIYGTARSGDGNRESVEEFVKLVKEKLRDSQFGATVVSDYTPGTIRSRTHTERMEQ